MPNTQLPACEILLPVFNSHSQVRRCIDSLARTLPERCQVRLLDDASTDLRLMAYLDELDGRYPWLRIHRFENNLGFVGNVNRGLRQATTDVVLLNSDTTVTPGWLERMLACAASDPRIGIVCPLSNNATILSVPEMNQDNRIPASMDIDAFAKLIARCAVPTYPRLPVAVGFCMLIRKPVIDAIGLLHLAFQLGYGEECDFSLRAWEAGYQVACCDDAFVYHEGESSFAAIPDIEQVRARNAATLEARWPFYNQLVSRWCQYNPLRNVQERIHTALCEARGDEAPHVLQVIHKFDSLGGTELHSKWIAESLSDRYRVTMLFPSLAENPYCDIETHGDHEFVRALRYQLPPREHASAPPSLILDCPASLRNPAVETRFRLLLEAGAVKLVHFQHLLHWGSLALPLIAKSLGLPVVLSLHDYYLFCPVFDLLEPSGHACGKAGAEASTPKCRKCIATHSSGDFTPEDAGSYLKQRRALLEQVIAASDAIIAPSEYVREKFAALYGRGSASKVTVIPHGLPPLRNGHNRQTPGPKPIAKARQKHGFRIGIFANLNRRKGAEVVIAAARLLADIPGLELVHHGGIDENMRATLKNSGIRSRGVYHPDELRERASDTELALVPSVYEETFCLTIAELQALGVPVLAFRVGAVTERIEDGKTGFLVDSITPVALANRVRALMQQREGLHRVRQRLKQRQNKALQVNADEYARLYQGLLQQEIDTALARSALGDVSDLTTDPREFTRELLTSFMPTDPIHAIGTAHDANQAYSRWLAQGRCAIPTDRPVTREFASALDIMVVAIEAHPRAITATLASLRPAVRLGTRVTLVAARDVNTEQLDLAGIDIGTQDFACLALQGENPTRQLNQWISRSDRDWILVMRPGMQLHADAIAIFAAYQEANPKWVFIYADDDLITENGRHYQPRFKPAFNLDLLRSQDYIGPLAVFSRADFQRCGGFARFPNAALYDLCLNFIDLPASSDNKDIIGHIPEVLFHLQDDTAKADPSKTTQAAYLKALVNHLERRKLKASARPTDRPDIWWVEYSAPRRQTFSLVILSADAGNNAARTIDNLRSVADDFEVIILDLKGVGSISPDLRRRHPDIPIQRLPAPAGQGIAGALNRALRACSREFIFVAQDSVRFHHHGGIQNLLGLLNRPDVGLVGPCITNPSGKIQQGYPIAGFWPFGATGQLHAGESLSETGFLARNLCPENCVTVSDRFFGLRKSLFLQCSAFSERAFPNAWYLLDFGLRLADAGFLATWTPHVVLVEEFESSFHRWQRKNLQENHVAEEIASLYERWLPRLARDPAHNPNLGLREPQTWPEAGFKKRWIDPIHQGPKILGIPGDTSGSGHYRVIDPLHALEEAGLAFHSVAAPGAKAFPPSPVELERLGPTAVLFHNCLHDRHLHALALYRQYSDARLILSLDDLLTALPEWNPFRASNYPDIDQRLRMAMESCHRVVVSTSALAEGYRDLHNDIVVIPNRLRASRWSHLAAPRREPHENPKRKPRIGWAGAPQHEGDLAWLQPVIAKLSGEAEWYFFGMCPENIKKFATKVLPMVDFCDYPDRLREINLDVAIAPLASNDFNRCKSNLKILEHGILGTTVICSDIEPYRDAPVVRLENRPDLWEEALRDRISDVDATKAEGHRLLRWVSEQGFVERHLDVWYEALAF